ncbi:MAG: hypothetical protein QOJ52_1800 [Acidimicrobiaceae bacterium]|jgi:hypothetical protein|nr:hypothetical protein [Acidimicrobiaceae bacterium]MDQ1416698.1 hypothetical protein [Acidimicrobiaceae bacterium]MDQ1419838.1 hypothetical protein [Acidimicrobiaceae bacterium]
MPCPHRCVESTSGDVRPASGDVRRASGEMRREGGDGELICWLAGSAAAAMVSSPNKVTS